MLDWFYWIQIIHLIKRIQYEKGKTQLFALVIARERRGILPI